MLRQYFEMKSRVPDAILFYRMGDFYEMFFDDAREAAPLLGIALTARNRDSDIEAPMCGVPWHSADAPHRATRGGGPQGRRLRPGRRPARGQGARPARHHSDRDPWDRRSIRRHSTPTPPATWPRSQPAEPAWGIALLDLSTGRFHAGLRRSRPPPGARSPSSGRGRSSSRKAPSCPSTTGLSVTHRSGGLVRRGPVGGPPRRLGRRRDGRGRPRRGGRGPRLRGRVPAPAASHTCSRRQLLRFDERMRLDASAVATLELFESSDGPIRAAASARSSIGRGLRWERAP